MNNIRFTTEQWISLVEKDYPNLDFSKVNYINARTNVLIRCKIHNYEFYVMPDNLRSHKQKGCKFCGIESSSKKQSLVKEDFIKNTPHKEFDYSNIIYTSAKKEIKNIKCIKHNYYFSAKNVNYFNSLKYPCPICLNESGKHNLKKTNIEYINQLKKLNLDLIYDFSKVNYINAKTKIILICKKCGKEFKHSPRTLLRGVSKACPYCNYYIGEELIKKILNKNNIDFIFQYHCHELGRLSLDFYIPKLKVGIEYQGEQHYRPISFFGGIKRYKSQQEKDERKRNICKQLGIKEIEIRYDQNILTVLKENGIIS